MNIEFDAAKDAFNIAKHSVSLARAIDFKAVAYREDDRYDYGELRFLAFGHIDSDAYCLTFTLRHDRMRVISLRRAHDKEMKRNVP